MFVVALAPYGITPSQAEALASQVQAYLLSTYGLGNNSYLLLTGAAKVQGALIYALLNNIPVQTALGAPSAQLVAGDYFDDATSATVGQ